MCGLVLQGPWMSECRAWLSLQIPVMEVKDKDAQLCWNANSYQWGDKKLQMNNKKWNTCSLSNEILIVEVLINEIWRGRDGQDGAGDGVGASAGWGTCTGAMWKHKASSDHGCLGVHYHPCYSLPFNLFFPVFSLSFCFIGSCWAFVREGKCTWEERGGGYGTAVVRDGANGPEIW